jgi:hypothetical protein
MPALTSFATQALSVSESSLLTVHKAKEQLPLSSSP